MGAKNRTPAKKTAPGKTPPGPAGQAPKKMPSPNKQEAAAADHRPATADGFPIVGIGASAGGLEAFEAFLKQVPADCGMAFVLVQHLDPAHKSILTELVRRVTPMRVFEVSDGMQVQPNCAYIIPPNRDMSILHGTLQLIEPSEPRGLRLPIDYFFRALAMDQAERAICVILSGTGSDGTLGLKAVKEAGGMAMVQDPQSAKYDGMPRSAIATGLVDDTLAPERMVERLRAYVDYAFAPGIKRPALPQPKKTEDLNKVFVLLRGQTGHDFSYYKPNTILRRIDRRMNLHQIERFKDYVRYLQKTPLEVETLFKELLIGVSSFFRDPEAFLALKEKVIPALFKDRPPEEAVRVWVPGCSTGEEAYSIAMLLREHMDNLGREYKLQVFATDIDSNAIERARSGTFPDSIAADVPPQYLRRFFSKEGNSYQVTKVVRDILVFSEQNLIKDPPFSRLDLISCRNLLIYLEGELQKRLLPLFHYALREDGHLFLGNSETIGEATDLFAVLERKWKIYRRKGGAQAATRFDLGRAAFPLELNAADNGREVKLPRAPSSRELTERLLLEEYAPACVLVSEKGEGLYFHGATGKYLQPPIGEANWNIVGMARQGLQLDLSTALRKAVTHRKAIRFEKVAVKTNGDTQLIDLSVKPLPEQPGQGVILMVVFEEVAPSDAKEKGRISEPSVAADRRVMELERELRSNREYLQSTIEELETSNEELKSTNEELQSANEELQSTNEELETSKEELQSVNEELVTVNAEHEVNLQQLTKANNDMANLLASNDMGTIFLGIDLCIQRFTPAATRVVKLIPTDVGRPLSDIATHLTADDLVDRAEQVLKTLESQEEEIKTRDAHWYSVRIRPYRTVENVIEGVVITFVDIDKRKQAEQIQNESEQHYRLFFELANDALVLIDPETGNIVEANQFAYRHLGYTREAFLRLSLRDIEAAESASDIAEHARAIIQSGGDSFETKHRSKDGYVRDVLVKVKTLTIGGRVHLLSTWQDIEKGGTPKVSQ